MLFGFNKPDPPAGGSDVYKLRTLLISAIVSVGLTVIGLISALLANSVTLWANSARVGLETAVCVFAYYAVWKGRRASAESYNYGLGKLENLTALAAGLVILVTFLVVGWNTVERIRVPVTVIGAGFGFWALTFSMIFNVWVYSRFLRLKAAGDSPVTESQTVVYRNALLATFLSLVAVGTSHLFPGQWWALYVDPAGAVLLCGFLLKSGIGLTRKSLDPLLDSALEESAQIEITRQLVRHFEDYHQLVRIRTRRSGAQTFIEVFLEFDDALRHRDVLLRMAALKKALEESVPGAEVWIIPV